MMVNHSGVSGLIKVVLLGLALGLASCQAPGTDSGNPEMNTGLSDDINSPEWHRGNPFVRLIDEGLCLNLQRCASEFSGVGCRGNILNAKGFSEFFKLSMMADLALVGAVENQQVLFDSGQSVSCIKEFGRDEFCKALEIQAGSGTGPVIKQTDQERLTITVQQVLKASPSCAGLMTKPQ